MSGVTPHLLPAPSLCALPPKLPPTFSLFFPKTHHKINSSLSYPTSFHSSPVSNGRTGFSSFASNNHRTSNSIEDEEEEVKGEEKSMLTMPLHEMQSWFENKPVGFGEGKNYDTSAEDKIVEEMEQTRRAQLANINKLKHSSPQQIAAMKKKEMEMQKALEAAQCGVEVRIGNLPRKKNIHRDLQSAFKGFPGILHISPAVSGNKKTRDPICKGFAFIYLKSEQAADSFLQMYSNQNIQFGKIQKQITCEMTNSQSAAESAAEQSAVSTSVSAAQLKVADMREETDADSNVDSPTWDSEEEMFSEWSAMGTHVGTETLTQIIYNMDDEPMFSDTEVIVVGSEDFSISEPNKKKEGRPRNEGNNAIADSTSLKQPKNLVARKPQHKAKSGKDLRLNILGAAKRLQIKEKAVLAGVFSKYGGKADSGCFLHEPLSKLEQTNPWFSGVGTLLSNTCPGINPWVLKSEYHSFTDSPTQPEK